MTTTEFAFYRRAELVKFFKTMFSQKHWRASVSRASHIPVGESYRWLRANLEGSVVLQNKYEIFAYSIGFKSVLDEPVKNYLKQLQGSQAEIEFELQGLKRGMGKPGEARK